MKQAQLDTAQVHEAALDYLTRGQEMRNRASATRSTKGAARLTEEEEQLMKLGRIALEQLRAQRQAEADG